MLKTISRDLVSSVRELMERGWGVVDIAAKMNLDADDVQLIVNLINILN
jgi:hypothetical protein